jgi:hypothetical protein
MTKSATSCVANQVSPRLPRSRGGAGCTTTNLPRSERGYGQHHAPLRFPCRLRFASWGEICQIPVVPSIYF